MYRNKTVAVVVPAYNEETQINKVIDAMPSLVDKIIIVNDCSKDRTAQVVMDNPAYGRSGVILISHEVNQGVGGAIATGYKWCRDNKIDIAVVMAGDAQMDPDDLPALLDPVVEGRTDYSKGNRLVSDEAFTRIPKVRLFGNAALSLLTKIASGYWHVADSQTGYTAINALGLRLIDWDKMYKRYGQPNDVLVKLNVAGLRVLDIPIKPVYNVGERSGIKVRKVLFSISGLLLRLFFWRLKEKYVIRNFHPLVFFYAFGFFGMFIGTIMFLRIAYILATSGDVPEISFLTWLFTLGMTFNSFAFAMWFDYEENKHLNPPLQTQDLAQSGAIR
jgi:glycosyltransferase involved in cell wall biosynthesis